jgi:hypothetical protein
VASFTNIKLFVLAGVGHRDRDVNKTRNIAGADVHGFRIETMT